MTTCPPEFELPRRGELPAGRLLYKPTESVRYLLVSRGRPGELWLVEDGWTAESDAAGPFHPEDALRAFRLANTMVPEGCELGPWQPGIALFARSKLPSHPGGWARMDATWLPPSVSRYSSSDMNEVVHETCCTPAGDRPRIRWSVGDTTVDPDLIGDLVRARYPELRLNRGGTLSRAWNIHPEASPVLAEDEDMKGAFVVVDLPPVPPPLKHDK